MELRPLPVNSVELRRVYGCHPSGVTAVCAMVDGVPIGMAASSFTSVSVEPPLVSICIQNDSRTWPRLKTAARLGLSVLAEHHGDACRTLSRKDGDRFAGVPWMKLASGAVVVSEASAWLECRLRSEVAAGDHMIAVLEVCALDADADKPPLVFHGSRFHRIICAELLERA
ncbi:flavin reductase family protein [Mycolicibacterium elephantis]|uniref:flavin reductase family protein n=1 Tax=Mycolicibacterium elephantis TaxID=81858 RepID=UPI000AD836D3|nr:flavin reductase family protein [Mycolicibacterium elephantis]